jgi:hypothetical protein
VKTRCLIGGIAGALVVSGCGSGNGSSSGSSTHHYPTNIRSNFLNACEANGGAVSKCGCSLKWFESHVSLARLMADERTSKHGSLPSDFTKAIRACG